MAVPVPLPPSKPKAPLVRIGTQFFREIEVKEGHKKKTLLVPVDVEANLDPLELLKAAGVVVGGAFASWVAWHGVEVANPFGGAIKVIPGLKESPFWQDVASRLMDRLAPGSAPVSPEEARIITEEVTIAPTPEGLNCCEQCRKLHREGRIGRAGLIACLQRCNPMGEPKICD